MKTVNIVLHSIDQVKNFVNTMSRIEGEATLFSGRYVIDAKSIMGIFSLELTKPMKLEIENWKDEYEELIKKYIDKSEQD